MEELRRLEQQRARADAFFSRSYAEVMADIAAVITPAMRAKELTPPTKVEEPAPMVEGRIASNVVSLDAYRATLTLAKSR